MGYDPVRDEVVVMQPQLSAITTYRGDANGDVPPIRIIMGPKTQIRGSDRVTLDPLHHEYFVKQLNKILVFDQDADGDVAPIRVLDGPADFEPTWASTVTVDPVHNLLIASGHASGFGFRALSAGDLVIDPSVKRRGSLEGGSIGQLAIFDRTASGNAKPLRVITGSKTMLSSDTSLMTTYPPRGWIVAGVWGSEYGEVANFSPHSFVGVWSIFDQGDVPPRWTIGGPNGILRQVRGVTLDPKHKTVIVSDRYLNGVLSFEFPEIF
jgi:hypothetical protein